MHFIYGNEVATIRVIVKYTTKPEIKAPTSIDIFQYTDLSTFNFDELLESMDDSDVKDWIVNTSKVDVNTVGTYKLKVSIQDKYKNKASKKLKVNVVQALEVAEGEVSVTEIITDEDGNKKIVITKKSNNQVSKTDVIVSTSPVSNTGTVKSDTINTKPTTNTGSSTLAPGNNSSGSSN